jgi:hypothetical protein
MDMWLPLGLNPAFIEELGLLSREDENQVEGDP